MLYQVTAYDVLGGITLQATTAEPSDSGYHWEHRVLEHVEIPEGVSEDPWDVLWFIGQTLCDRAMRRRVS